MHRLLKVERSYSVSRLVVQCRHQRIMSSILVEGCLYSDSTFVLMSTRDCSGDGVTGDDGGYGYVTGDKIITSEAFLTDEISFSPTN